MTPKGRLVGPWWTPLALVGASVAANLVVWAVARISGPASVHDFFPLTTPLTVILFTTLGALGAYSEYWLLARLTPNPRPVFLAVAVVMLLLSFLPDLCLPPSMGGWSPFAIGTLMVMHVVAAVVNVSLLLHLTRA